MIKRVGLTLIYVLAIIIIAYVLHLAVGLIGLPGNIESFCDLIIALLALFGIVYLAYLLFTGGSPPAP